MVSMALSHLGICVRDLERSSSFYCQALGFMKGVLMPIGSEAASLIGLGHDISFRSQFVSRDELRLELIQFDQPAALLSPAMRPMNHTGFTHLAFRVEAVDIVADTITSLGGQIHRKTRIQIPHVSGSTITSIFYSDPDGVRIELMELPVEMTFDVASDD